MTIITLLKYLPEVLALLKALQNAIEKAEEEKKIKDELKNISDAFNTGDASKLKSLFSNEL